MNKNIKEIYKRDKLTFKYDDFEPFMDKETMKLHYEKHHANYTNKLNIITNKLEKISPDLYNGNIIKVLSNLDVLEEQILKHYFKKDYDKYLKQLINDEVEDEFLEKEEQAINDFSMVINNGGGYYNHNFLWSILKNNGGNGPSKKFLNILEREFGSFERFQELFKKEAESHFGSGWTWLVKLPKVNEDTNTKIINNENEYELAIISTNNQDSVLQFGVIPLIAIDLWEHAYYLQYQNRRSDYISAYYNCLNWDKVEKLYNQK